MAGEPVRVLTRAAEDVLAERQRQIEVEGWTPEHDDEHGWGAMALASASYAIASRWSHPRENPPSIWPWERPWWKLASPRQMLVKAGALILAELERRDRLANRPVCTEIPDAE